MCSTSVPPLLGSPGGRRQRLASSGYASTERRTAPSSRSRMVWSSGRRTSSPRGSREESYTPSLRSAVLASPARMIEDLWYKNAVLYSLSLEVFMDGNGDGCGDFEGLTRRLDYLESLGV